MKGYELTSTLFLLAMQFDLCLLACDTTMNATGSAAHQNSLVSLVLLPKASMLSEESVLELKVRKTSKKSKKKYIYEVSAVLSEKDTGNASRESYLYLGSFSYFAPEPIGGSSTFIIPLENAINQFSEPLENLQSLRIKIEAIGFEQEPSLLDIELIRATILTDR